MAVSYLTGNEKPTAATMNLLWSEAESIVDKTMDGKSIYLAHPSGIIAPTESVTVGKEFYFYTSGNHDATDVSALYSLRAGSLPASYNQSTYDTAVSGATYSYYDSTLNYAITAGPLGLEFSLKAHTMTHSGTEYYVWDMGQPSPEKHWRYAVAEIIIGDSASDGSGGYKFEFSNDYDKYNCFKLHNLTDEDLTFYFGTSSSHNYSLTIPKFSQMCVRRDSVSSGYDSTYKYFFKCFADDPRFLNFKSHSGFVADSMRANNITNASFLYNILEAIGQRAESITPHLGDSSRIVFNPTTYTDVGGEYATDGYVPTISNSTLVGDLIFHKGDISYFRATSAGSTPETGSISFDGFSSFNTAMAGAGLTSSIGVTTSNIYETAKIEVSTSKDIFYLWQQSSNLLVLNDSPRVLDLGATSGGDCFLETGIGSPVKCASSTPAVSDGIMGVSESSAIDSTSTTVAQYITAYQNELVGHATSAGENIKLTTEGPVLFSTEYWPIATTLTATAPAGVFDGFSINNYFDVTVDSSGDAQISVITDRAIAYKVDGSESRSGWPSNRNKHHRLFEGPKHPKLYEDRGSAYTHLDITNDPVGLDGADFEQNDIGTLTESNVSFQTSAIETKIEPFGISLTDNRSYPLTLPGDASHELELKKAAGGTTISEFQAAIAGSATLYIRTNLLKEHYNDLVTILKKCKKIRPLCFDEVYFGDAAPIVGGMVQIFSNFGNYIIPKECYSCFTSGSTLHLLYTRLLGSSAIKTRSDFPDDIYTDAVSPDQAVMNDFYWVTIGDVRAKAAAMGFKFRYEGQFALATFTQPAVDLGGLVVNIDTFTMATSGNWKIPITLPVLSGTDYLSAFSDATTYINYYACVYKSRLIGKATNSNRAILIYTEDTSRSGYPATSTRAKFAEKQLASGGPAGADYIQLLNSDETTVTPTDKDGQYVYYCQVTPPVIHF